MRKIEDDPKQRYKKDQYKELDSQVEKVVNQNEWKRRFHMDNYSD